MVKIISYDILLAPIYKHSSTPVLFLNACVNKCKQNAIELYNYLNNKSLSIDIIENGQKNRIPIDREIEFVGEQYSVTKKIQVHKKTIIILQFLHCNSILQVFSVLTTRMKKMDQLK